MEYVSRLKALVTKIEEANLPPEEKYRIYKIVRDLLQNLTTPILTKYMDQDKLMDLSQHLEEITPAKYLQLVLEAVQDKRYASEFNEATKDLIEKIEIALKESGLIQV